MKSLTGHEAFFCEDNLNDCRYGSSSGNPT
jgi:hypothetical protein